MHYYRLQNKLGFQNKNKNDEGATEGRTEELNCET
jgi:hypothetical protein